MGAVFPWPARSERKAAIARARGDRQAAEARAAHAARVEEQIRQITEANHFAEVIAAQLAFGGPGRLPRNGKDG